MIHVMKKAGKSYAKIGNSCSISLPEGIKSTHLVNGKVPCWGNGDRSWCVFDGEITSIEVYRPGKTVPIHYKRIADAPQNLPEIIQLDRVVRDEDWDYVSLDGFDLGNYQMVYRQEEGSWESLEFDVIDRDCEPVTLPAWCVVDWPANIEHYPEQQHKYPCSITARSLFGLIVEKVAEIVRQSQNLDWNDYRNIGTFTIKHRVEIPDALRRREKREVYKTARSRKPTTEYVTPQYKWIDLVTVNGFYKDSSREEVKVPSLRGENFAELQKKVDEYVDSIVSLCDPEQWHVCEACQGRGIVRLND